MGPFLILDGEKISQLHPFPVSGVKKGVRYSTVQYITLRENGGSVSRPIVASRKCISLKEEGVGGQRDQFGGKTNYGTKERKQRWRR